jgi:hypothetical protein
VATTTIDYFTSQLATIDRAIGETIDRDVELRRRRDLLLSVIGVGEMLAALLLTECPSQGFCGEVVRSSPMRAQSEPSPLRHVNRPSDAHLQDWQCHSTFVALHAGNVRHALQLRGRGSRGPPQKRGPPQAQADRGGGDAQALGNKLSKTSDQERFQVNLNAINRRHYLVGAIIGCVALHRWQVANRCVPNCCVAPKTSYSLQLRLSQTKLVYGEHALAEATLYVAGFPNIPIDAVNLCIYNNVEHALLCPLHVRWQRARHACL